MDALIEAVLYLLRKDGSPEALRLAARLEAERRAERQRRGTWG